MDQVEKTSQRMGGHPRGLNLALTQAVVVVPKGQGVTGAIRTLLDHESPESTLVHSPVEAMAEVALQVRLLSSHPSVPSLQVGLLIDWPGQDPRIQLVIEAVKRHYPKVAILHDDGVSVTLEASGEMPSSSDPFSSETPDESAPSPSAPDSQGISPEGGPLHPLRQPMPAPQVSPAGLQLSQPHRYPRGLRLAGAGPDREESGSPSVVSGPAAMPAQQSTDALTSDAETDSHRDSGPGSGSDSDTGSVEQSESSSGVKSNADQRMADEANESRPRSSLPLISREELDMLLAPGDDEGDEA